MRFKTDENAHPAAAVYLCQHGHDAVTVWDETSRGFPMSGLLKGAGTKAGRW